VVVVAVVEVVVVMGLDVGREVLMGEGE